MDQPNILLITTDQQRFDTLHAVKLVATEKSADLDKTGRNPWPGHHGRDFPADVLH